MSRPAVMEGAARPIVGAFGKLPALGDFVRRRLPTAFIDTWDTWLQGCIVQSRDDLGVAWLNSYLTSPFWRFALSTDVCGEAAAGILMPSVDAVGRHYPLTLAAVLPLPCNVFDLVGRQDGWFLALEEIALQCLHRDFSTDLLEDQMDGAPPLIVKPEINRHCHLVAPVTQEHLGWTVEMTASGWSVADLWPAVLDQLVAAAWPRFSLWWTTGSDDLPASFHIYQGLPPASAYAVMLCKQATATEMVSVKGADDMPMLASRGTAQ